MALSPRELAALEEEEHQRWMWSIEGEGRVALGFAIGGAVVVVAAVLYLMSSGLPG